MKGDKKAIDYLNAVLKGELTAINQYFMHYRMLENWGVLKLAKYEYHESIDEMKHADKLMERILFLDGLPNLQTLNRLRIGENVPEILAADLELEYEALTLLKEAIPYCESIRDFGTRELLTEILEAEEEHIDFIEKQQQMIKDQGLQNYIQLQSEAAGS
ncbi:bacterioferritin [Sandaracinobacter neustonicus]|uniref:Bacterioferritin n=1 Tax=Sandaracinobacter neustonicus TaxID=1715348 RepID=A0A501XFJ7_9SPHN|nr:bacterioferritin [Sandaracinobacter neustonicus]TPE59107.1 bacterioferritin [Sandaracinobacter neustonicus]